MSVVGPGPAGRAALIAAAFAAQLTTAGCRTGPVPVATSAPSSASALPTSRPATGPPADDPIVARGILRRDGERIVDTAGRPVRWRGVAFGNQVWGNLPLPLAHHDETDYQRVRAIGMNTVRFYMHYRTFEDDRAPGVFKPAGWAWLDRNVAWARRHGIYLILNMHVPPGGYQSNAEGKGLWEGTANQDRLAALWRAIAARYANEPIIAGYDILNEPGVPTARSQWQALATRLTAAIRQVDPRHIIIVERVNAVGKEWRNDSELNFVIVDDPNVVYTFHFYDPLTYTHQFAHWVSMGEGGAWPDDGKVGRPEYAAWTTVASFPSPRLPAGDSGWTHAETKPLTSANPRALVGRISLVGNRLGGGRAVFDDVTVTERDEGGARVGKAVHIDMDKLGGWVFWSKDGGGRNSRTSEGHDDQGALTIEATTGDANLGGAQHEVVLRPGHSYTVGGWMRGERLPTDAVVQIRFDLIDTGGPLQGWNKQFLRTLLDGYVAWGHARGVPLFLGEFGVHRPCFENDRGGLTWVADMLDLLDERGLPFAYHDYHGDSFGLYRGGGRIDPARANQALIDLFKRKLAR
jgi:endoglucanase